MPTGGIPVSLGQGECQDKSSLGEESLVLIEGSNRVIPSKKLIIENQR